MKIVLLITCIVGLLGIVIYGQACTQDYECGIPYGYCGGSSECGTTINGLTIDEVNGFVYYMATCRTPNSPYDNIVLKRVDVNGGVAVDIHSRVAIASFGNPQVILDFVNGFVYYGLSWRAPSDTLSAINVATLEDVQRIPTGAPFQNSFAVSDDTSYVCNFFIGNGGANTTIYRISGVVGQLGAGIPEAYYKLAGFNGCGPMRQPAGSEYLYFVERLFNTEGLRRSLFLRMLVDCIPVDDASCSIESLFIVDEYVNDFDVYQDSAIIFGTPTGLYSGDIETGSVELLQAGLVTGVRLFSGRAFWNDGVGIKSGSLSGGAVQQVNQERGVCTCVENFYGPSCTSCNGQVQWSFGKPSCVPLANEVPQTCRESWQCGNVPYIACRGLCECVSNFTGLPSCTTCPSPKVISWTQFGPICE